VIHITRGSINEFDGDSTTKAHLSKGGIVNDFHKK